MENIIIVKADEKDIYSVQDLFYRNEALNNLLATVKDSLYDENMKWLLEEIVNTETALNAKKDSVASKYAPADKNVIGYNYNFITNSIEFSIM